MSPMPTSPTVNPARVPAMICAALLCLLGLSPLGTAAEHKFFPFDNAFTKGESVEEQVALLKDLGYDGIGSRPKNATDALFAALDKHGLEMCTSYVVLPVDGKNPAVPDAIAAHFARLKGRDTLIWLSLNNPKAKDEDAARLIQKVCDLASAHELEVVLYPHVGACTDTVAKCLRLWKLADRPELGLSFTLCHFLAQNDPRQLEDTIRSIGPQLKLVQINGADHKTTEKPDWNELIKPLGDGNVDLGRVMRTLDEVGYQGPVNLQCYQLDQAPSQHLKASMQAWKALNQSAGATQP